jgi:GR25 family glycosyltransferase involved in LPS biosynthesis
MDSHEDRRTFMEDGLAQANLSATRIVGVNGRALSDEEIETLAPKEAVLATNKRIFLKGEVGCALSHRNIYDDIIKNNIPYAVIMEDDITIPTNFKNIVETLLHNHTIKNSWDYIAFDYTEPGLHYLRFWLRSIKIRVGHSSSFITSFSIIVSACIKGLYIFPLSLFEAIRNYLRRFYPGPVIFFRPLYLAGCYLITNKTAHILRELNTPIIYPADKVQNQARIKRGLRLRAYAPLIIRQEKFVFGSIITGKNGKDL